MVLKTSLKDLSNKTRIIYFDEFQVTNIVDAMILGKLFKKIFEEKIKVIFSSNTILMIFTKMVCKENNLFLLLKF